MIQKITNKSSKIKDTSTPELKDNSNYISELIEDIMINDIFLDTKKLKDEYKTKLVQEANYHNEQILSELIL